MSENVLCLYHAHCIDGSTAAWAVRKAHPEAECVPCQHRKPFNLAKVIDRDVVIVDFSFPYKTMVEIIEMARSFTILDHHKSADKAIQRINQKVKEGRWVGKEVVGVYDKHRSGAMLAWNHFHPTERAPELVQYVQDHDLWAMQLKDTREVIEGLSLYPRHIEVIDQHVVKDPKCERLIRQGRPLLRRKMIEIGMLLRNSVRPMTIGGHEVKVANAPIWYANELASKMFEGCTTFVAVYNDTPSQRIFSLRSAPNGMDVSLIAEMYGGGGSEHSAAFSVPRDHELAQW